MTQMQDELDEVTFERDALEDERLLLNGRIAELERALKVSNEWLEARETSARQFTAEVAHRIAELQDENARLREALRKVEGRETKG